MTASTRVFATHALATRFVWERSLSLDTTTIRFVAGVGYIVHFYARRSA